MARRECACGAAHRDLTRRVVEQFLQRTGKAFRVLDLYRRTSGQGGRAGLREVEHMRAEHHGRADRAGLDQILSTERQQTPTDERNIRRRIVGGQLTHRIAEHDLNGVFVPPYPSVRAYAYACIW